MHMDKWMLWGAVSVMAAVGSFSFYKIRQTPAIDPEIVRLEKALEVPADVIKNPAPPLPKVGPPPFPVVLETGRKPVHNWAGHIVPKLIGTAVPQPPQPVYVLPLPVIQKLAVADLDGITIAWTLKDAEVELQDYMIRKAAKPAGFTIQRQCGDGKVETMATLKADARSYTDLAVEPRQTYRYWVTLTGQETDLTKRPLKLADATKSLPGTAEANTPSGVRVKLIGGDRTNALVRVETYDREQRKWIAKTVLAAPGREVGKSGWILNGLRFDNFTLVADFTDDGGVVRILKP